MNQQSLGHNTILFYKQCGIGKLRHEVFLELSMGSGATNWNWITQRQRLKDVEHTIKWLGVRRELGGSWGAMVIYAPSKFGGGKELLGICLHDGGATKRVTVGTKTVCRLLNPQHFAVFVISYLEQ